MKHNPYIYILFFILLQQTVYSQKTRTLELIGFDKTSELLLNQIEFDEEIKNDSIYLVEINKISLQLNQFGFIEHSLKNTINNDSLIVVEVSIRNLVKTIIIKHTDMPIISKELGYSLLDSTSIEIPFKSTLYFLEKIASYYKNNGFPFVKIHLNPVKKQKNKIIADLEINKSEERTIDKILIKGYYSFPKSFIKHVFKISEGDIFNQSLLDQTTSKCQNLSFVSEIKKPQVLFTKDSTSIYLYLKKEKNNLFDGLVGFSNSKEKKGIKLYGNINLKIQNTFNKGESLELHWMSTQNQSQTFDFRLKTPFLLNSPLSFNYNFNIHKQDTTYLNIFHAGNLQYALDSEQQVGLSIKQLHSNKTTNKEDPALKDFSSFFYGVSYLYKKTNPHIHFNKKIYLKSQIDQGKRSGQLQHRLTNNILYLIKINSKQNILLINTTEILLSKSYNKSELFRLGGSNSIRGFNENSLLASSYSFINLEYNYLINDLSFLSGISDIGYIENSIEKSKLYAYSFGVGFSQNTKIGQLSIQYFLGNTNENLFSLSNSKLHFKITQSF